MFLSNKLEKLAEKLGKHAAEEDAGKKNNDDANFDKLCEQRYNRWKKTSLNDIEDRIGYDKKNSHHGESGDVVSNLKDVGDSYYKLIKTVFYAKAEDKPKIQKALDVVSKKIDSLGQAVDDIKESFNSVSSMILQDLGTPTNAEPTVAPEPKEPVEF